MKVFPFFLFLLMSTQVLSQTSYVPKARLLGEKGQEIFLGADFFKTSANHNGRTKTNLSSGEKFERLQGEVGGRYGLARNFQIGVGARFRQNSSVVVGASDQQFSTSSSGLQSIFTHLAIGLDPVGRMQYTFEGLFNYVPYSNSEVLNPDDLILGDVGSDYSAGLAATYSSPDNNFLTLRGGWRKPGTYISSEIYWQAEAAAAWKHLALVAGVDGVTSLNNSDDGRPLYSTGRTALYHGTDRQWITPYLGLNLALGSNWRTELRASQVVQGRSTDFGTGFGIQIVRREEVGSNKLVDSKFKAYDTEVTITKVSPKKGYVVIDKGLGEDIVKGMRFDFYEFDYVGGNVLVARGVVIEVKVDSSVVKITQHYNLKKEIKLGLVGRGQLK